MSDKEIDKLVHVLQQQVPQAWGVAQHVAQVDAWAYLIPALIAAVVCGIAMITLLAKAGSIPPDKYESKDDRTPYYIATVISGVGCFAAVCALAFAPWAWITAFNPTLGAAHQILAHIGIQ